MIRNGSSLEQMPGREVNWLLFIGIIFIGSNLRAPLTSVGSLIPFIRDDLGISHALAGTITTLPLLAFAFLSPFAPKIATRLGMERTILFSLILLTVGLITRSMLSAGFLFGGTIMIGLAIAVGNVLLPGYIKMNFPYRIGVMTGIYAVFMNVFGALGSGLSVPISTIKGMGWKGSLAVWAILSFIAILFWLPQLRKQNKPTLSAAASKKRMSVWRSPLAWNITLFMGLQSLMFYTLMTWLPDILQSHGFSSSGAGWMLFLMQFALIPITFVIPVIADKMKNQKVLAGVTALLFFLGIVALMIGSKSLLYVSVILIGVAGGSAFSLSMMFFSLRTTDGQQATELSGMAQSFGYLLAAIGPVLFGALYDISGKWQLSLSMLMILSAVIFIVGIEAGKERVITDNTAQIDPLSESNPENS
ncbi:MFS transporter [Siminovitchia terrae]|uniref:MFS transporter n=2 Tax=Siminovitchia terrae TaxID=1914933 RepID=A0A429XD69_SIMTE|nr:MFS transporter [Siminovitchia terrae]